MIFPVPEPLFHFGIILIGLTLGFSARSFQTADDTASDGSDGNIPRSFPDPQRASERQKSIRTKSSDRPNGALPPLTARQVELLLEDPAKYQFQLGGILGHRDLTDPFDDKSYRANELEHYAEFFRWDEEQKSVILAVIEEFASAARDVIDETAVIDDSDPTKVWITFPESEKPYAVEIAAFKSELRSELGNSEVVRMEKLGFFSKIDRTIGQDTKLGLELEASALLENETGFRLTLDGQFVFLPEHPERTNTLTRRIGFRKPNGTNFQSMPMENEFNLLPAWAWDRIEADAIARALRK